MQNANKNAHANGDAQTTPVAHAHANYISNTHTNANFVTASNANGDSTRAHTYSDAGKHSFTSGSRSVGNRDSDNAAVGKS